MKPFIFKPYKRYKTYTSLALHFQKPTGKQKPSEQHKLYPRNRNRLNSLEKIHLDLDAHLSP